MKGAWVWSLVGELGSHMPCSVAKKKFFFSLKKGDGFKALKDCRKEVWTPATTRMIPGLIILSERRQTQRPHTV